MHRKYLNIIKGVSHWDNNVRPINFLNIILWNPNAGNACAFINLYLLYYLNVVVSFMSKYFYLICFGISHCIVLIGICIII